MAEQLAAAAAAALGPLLKAYWALAAGSVIATLLPVPLPRAFKDAVTLAACRGKLWHSKPDALGPLRDWSVPQSWFLHFYLLGAACNAATLAAFACCGAAGAAAAAGGAAAGRAALALALFQFHLLRRAAETAFIMRYPRDARMHGIAYLFGLSYYAAVPLSLLPDGWLRSLPHALAAPTGAAACVDGWRAEAGELLKQGPAVAALAGTGAATFLLGNALQFASHLALARLAGDAQRRSEKTAYRIPRGALFELVSCPHYLAEIIIYCGLALAAGGSANTLLMLVWVSVNLVLAAGATQAWYRARFKTYPEKRRALVPYVY
ncbi:polyprenol reductase-like [Raphidocelis subcapitata]|uniref:Polyprenol reductase-like n=1 Tax=Raphidocelis subcapitata TaxID=307507 RepID=A0A2V0PHE8_9CHLO|nr:polyprenol reductase-like [Raphidocelis subcapitata]|eukprot:GBF99251.1 polyprenol reductase-like [Raphidocelis subcapitata]